MIKDPIDFMVRCFFFGGLFTTSVYCFIAYLSRGREKISLSYALFTFSAALVFLGRRLLPDLIPGDHALFFAALTIISAHGVVGSGLHFFVTFLDIKRSSRAFRFFLLYYIAHTLLLIPALALLIGSGTNWLFFIYLAFIGVYSLCALGYIIWRIRTRRTALPGDKRLLVFFIILLLYLTTLVVVNLLIPDSNYYFVIIALYLLLIAFIYLQGYKMNNDFRELAALKTDLEKKVGDRTAQIEGLLKKNRAFFTSSTHDIKNLLMLIGCALERYMKSAPTHGDLELIRANLQKLQEDMQHRLDYSHPDGAQFQFNHDQATDLSWLLDEKIALFQPLAVKKGVALEGKTPGPLAAAADPVALDKLLNNLLDNAIKFTPSGGRVEAALARMGKRARLVVRDTGYGIPPGELSRVCDFSYRGEEERKRTPGSGMGLWIVSRIVEELGGELVLRSRPDRSGRRGAPWVTEASVTLPRARSAGPRLVDSKQAFSPSRPAAPAPAAGVPEPGRDAARATLLVVEDDAELLRLLCESLGETYNVWGAARGEEALRKLDALPGKPDIVITDIRMDGMDGYELFRELKARPDFLDVPVIFLTASSSPLERLRSLSDGAVDFITKPVSLEELQAKIQSLLSLIRNKKASITKETLEKVIAVVNDEHDRMPGREERFSRAMEFHQLTGQEQKITRLLRDGLPNKQIADRLQCAIRTIDSHLQNIYQKTETHSRTELLNKLTAFGEGDQQND